MPAPTSRARASCACSTSACPTAAGLDLLADLRSAGWQRLVVLSAADDPYSVRAAFVAGAQGYLLKTASPTVVADGVRRVLDGGVYADPSVASLLAAGLRGGPVDTGVSELSGREIEVLRLVADGQSNKQIGEQLGPVGADREEPPRPDRPQARHRRPRRDGRPDHARGRHPLSPPPRRRACGRPARA